MAVLVTWIAIQALGTDWRPIWWPFRSLLNDATAQGTRGRSPWQHRTGKCAGPYISTLQLVLGQFGQLADSWLDNLWQQFAGIGALKRVRFAKLWRNFDLFMSPSCSKAWPGTLDLNPSSNGITSRLAMFSVPQDLYHISYSGDYWSNDSGLCAQYSHSCLSVRAVVCTVTHRWLGEASEVNLEYDLKTSKCMSKALKLFYRV